MVPRWLLASTKEAGVLGCDAAGATPVCLLMKNRAASRVERKNSERGRSPPEREETAVFDNLRADVASVIERDPAAKSWWEVLLCYPYVRALAYHRLAHRLYLAGHTTLARWISQRARQAGGEVHPGAPHRGVSLGCGAGAALWRKSGARFRAQTEWNRGPCRL